MPMHRDFKELLGALNASGVRYLVIGGQAVNMYAQPRGTKDLDLWIPADPANAQALFKALTAFGAPLDGVTPQNILKAGEFYRMGVPPVMVDILCDVTGVTFEQAWAAKQMVAIDPAAGLSAHFISREHLMTAKQIAGRPQDLADVSAIQRHARVAQERQKLKAGKEKSKPKGRRR
jgi:hypothetical protein